MTMSIQSNKYNKNVFADPTQIRYCLPIPEALLCAKMECLNRHLFFTEYPNPLPKKFIPLPFPNKFQKIRSKIISTIFGQAVGDAVGFLIKFLSKERAELIYKHERIIFSCYLKDTHRSK
ncbi:hypothetical protein EIN_257960 [Entamoeba invadens IP1]|uniref:Uncharacterized protein n=1 Tax=Entamoeba invadens IP1 TaxID=370355 RepID=A0A0A1TV46_ENTIV|nr:hypothetical protein EIN_257960 [Entamoeba invadens IP1]ELP84182.1 hypothetical protein EIN_257960 [Entamoeba invadens IP1]|eukprot:XP_004183528.1 hypothetical protein EIN_257960 [Entamoeba invadens IP1]